MALFQLLVAENELLATWNQLESICAICFAGVLNPDSGRSCESCPVALMAERLSDALMNPVVSKPSQESAEGSPLKSDTTP